VPRAFVLRLTPFGEFGKIGNGYENTRNHFQEKKRKHIKPILSFLILRKGASQEAIFY